MMSRRAAPPAADAAGASPAAGAVPAAVVAVVAVVAVDDEAALRALFDRARAGDAAALDALCRAVRPRLFRVAHAVLHDPAAADDVAQEALVRAVTRQFLFLGTGSVGGWMTRIALNLAKNRRRDARRRGEILADAVVDDLVARGARPDATAPRADEALVVREQRARLRQALQQLPERQRDVVALRAVAGLDFAVVATTLGITESNARMAFANAKKKLLTLVGEAP
jgi:RNA polymerase sigma-70 factor (ECF subfamily)